MTMAAEMWILLLTTCFVCVCTSDELFVHGEPCDPDWCETLELQAPLGSPVLLPCVFATGNTSWVNWQHVSRKHILRLTSEGHIMFQDHQYGRVKAFPNQALQGNYSICIDGLKESDLGCYRCQQGGFCHQTELHSERRSPGADVWRLISICAGVVALVLLCVCVAYCSKKYGDLCLGRTEEDANNAVSNVSGPVGQQPNLVYENDDQGPASADLSRSPCPPPGAPQAAEGTEPSQSSDGIYPDMHETKFERVESQRTRLRFHFDLIQRLRQASIRSHYYVNRDEISKQQSEQAGNARRGLRKKKAKDNHEYNNPIYNRSTDQLHPL